MTGRVEQGSCFKLYVAANGDDRWSGREAEPNAGRTDGPLATLERARALVREYRAGQAPNRTITVAVRGGKFYLGDTLVLDKEDGGSREFPVRYQAHDAEQVILSGGRRITGWKPYKGEIVRAEIAGGKGGVWKFRQLFLNGKPQIRSRYPKFDHGNPLHGGGAFAEGPVERKEITALIYKPGTFPRPWAKPTNGEVFIFLAGGWTNNIVPIKSVDAEKRVITLAREVQNPDRDPWWVPSLITRGDRFRVENMLEDLTEPGEWCLDSEEGAVYFWPPHGALKASDEVVAPVLDTLISIRGASWIRIAGFTFTESAGGDDLHRDGLDGYGPMYPSQGWKYCGEALHLREAEHCVIERNRFYEVGGNGIYLERYNARNVIRQNEIRNAGANGICLLGNHIRYPVPTYVPANVVPNQGWLKAKQPLPMFNEVTDNHIHHCGVFNKYVAGVFLGVSDGNLIAHNKITDMPAAAVNLGQNGFGRNFVEYNEIRRACVDTAPSGAIHLWMDNEKKDERSGHVIRFNLVADTQGCGTDLDGQMVTPHPRTHAIYLDNYAGNCVVFGNLIVRAPGNGLFVHAGKNHLIENNIFVDTAGGAIGCGYGFNPMPGFLTGHVIWRNITYSTKDNFPLYNFLFYHSSEEVVAQADWNTFFCRGENAPTVHQTKLGDVVEVTELSLAEWQEMGYDADSSAKDPLFVDPMHDDFRLKPDSPAIQLGFVPIALSMIGIRRIATESETREPVAAN
jgi:parallel beta-helix repeat protein